MARPGGVAPGALFCPPCHLQQCNATVLSDEMNTVLLPTLDEVVGERLPAFTLRPYYLGGDLTQEHPTAPAGGN